MNQFRCKRLKSTVVLGFTMLASGFSTVTVEKAVSFQGETIVQLRTSTGHRPRQTDGILPLGLGDDKKA
jgi:hypothetical protein